MKIFKITLLLSFLIVSCIDDQNNQTNTTAHIQNENIRDSERMTEMDNKAQISIELPSQTRTGLNYKDLNLQSTFVQFSNLSNQDTILLRTVSINKPTIFTYRAVVKTLEGRNKIKQSILIKPNSINKIQNDNENKIFKINKHSYTFIDSLITGRDVESYDSFDKFYQSEIKSVLTELQKYYLKTLYIESLGSKASKNKNVEDFIFEIEPKVVSQNLYNIYYFYFDGNKNIDRDRLNDLENPYPSLGLFNYLKVKKSKLESSSKETYQTFKTLDIYKKDSLFFKSKLDPLNNDLFVKKITNILKNRSNIYNVKNLDKFILIDFWATWCAPCIQGVKTMKEMDMPKNVQVVSISVDKDKDHEKWKIMTKELAQEISFRLSDSIREDQDFLKFIELESIPRYILMDKDFNLIDQSFYHPQEPQFLPKLKDVKNHKNW